MIRATSGGERRSRCHEQQGAAAEPENFAWCLAVAASNLRYLSIYLVLSLFLVSESVQMNGKDHKFRATCHSIPQLFCVFVASGIQRIQPPMIESPKQSQ